MVVAMVVPASEAGMPVIGMVLLSVLAVLGVSHV